MDTGRSTPRSRDIFDGYRAPPPSEDAGTALPSVSAMYNESVKPAAAKTGNVTSAGSSKTVPRKPLPRSIDILDAYKPVPSTAISADMTKPALRPFPLAFGNTTTCAHDDIEDVDDDDFATMMRNNRVRKPQLDLERQRAQQAQKESGWAADDKRTFLITLACTTAFTVAVLVVMLVVGYSNRGPFKMDRTYIVHGP